MKKVNELQTSNCEWTGIAQGKLPKGYIPTTKRFKSGLIRCKTPNGIASFQTNIGVPTKLVNHCKVTGEFVLSVS